MAMQWTIDQTVDLHKGVRTPQVWPEALMLCGDDRAHVWRVRVLDGGAPATLTGSVTGYFVRADGVTVSVTGALTGNVASVVLKSGCYAADGDMAAVMRLASEGTVLTLATIVLPVRRVLTDSIADPEHIVPSLDALLAQITAMEQGTEAAETAAESAEAGAAAATAAATAANTAAGRADDAAAAIEELTVSAAALAPGSQPTATVAENADGGKHIAFGVPAGEPGTGMEIKGVYASVAALAAAVTSPVQGDMYAIGAGEPYTIYMWDATGGTGGWVSLGEIRGAKGDTGAQGPKGDTGAQGPKGDDGVSPEVAVEKTGGVVTVTITDAGGAHTFTVSDGAKGDTGDTGATGAAGATYTPSVDADGNLSWSNNGGLDNPETVNIKGPAGETPTIPDSGWQALTLSDGVAAADTAFAVAPQYRKIANRVYIRGHVKCSVPSGGTLIAVLPEGYRVPSGTRYDIGECGGTRVSRIYADADGNLKCEWIQNIGGSAFTGETWIQIDMDYLTD